MQFIVERIIELQKEIMRLLHMQIPGYAIIAQRNIWPEIIISVKGSFKIESIIYWRYGNY